MQPRQGLSRRDFLKDTAVALPALAALPRLASALEPPVPGRSATAGRVIVVGAGLAGLAAAYELVAMGYDVNVLESQLRPGGRVRTIRSPFADGLYAEAGAINFGDGYQHLVRYVKTFALPVVAPSAGHLATVFHLRGKRLQFKPGEQRRWPFALTAEEASRDLGGMIQSYLAPAAEKLGDPRDPSWQLASFRSYDQLTLAELLKDQGASREAIALLGYTLGFGYGWSEVSALHRLISDVALFYLGNKSVRFIQGGSDLLPMAFAKALRDRIYYGSPVVRIVQEPGKVRAVFAQGGVERALDADRLVCTVPCPALRQIEFSPALPARKRRIVAQLEYAPVTRIYLQSRRRFWVDEGCSGSAATDLPIQLVSEHPFVRSADQGPRGILECHLKGAEAARVGAWGPAAQVAFAAEQLEKVHPGFKTFVEGGIAVNWSADPWAGGGYAWWKPGQLTEWLPALAQAEGRVHFAGEHTSILARTMEGALESGNRAAREIHDAAPA